MNGTAFTAILALAWFGALTGALSAVVTLAGWLIDSGVIRVPARRAATVLFALRVLPGAAATVFTCVIFLPAHWLFEPRDAEEWAGFCLSGLALLGAAVVAAAGRRALRDYRLTRALEHRWKQAAIERPSVDGGRLPVLEVADGTPVISLAGIRRPRLFIAKQIVELFTDDEIDVSLAHELAHRASRDNLKRALVSCCPDLVRATRAGRRLERRWRAAVEFAADAEAARGDEGRALSLASALIKVARLAPGGTVPVQACSPFYDGTLLWARIDRLLGVQRHEQSQRGLRRLWSYSAAVLTLVGAALAAEGLWLAVHLTTEDLIRMLP